MYSNARGAVNALTFEEAVRTGSRPWAAPCDSRNTRLHVSLTTSASSHFTVEAFVARYFTRSGGPFDTNRARLPFLCALAGHIR